MLDKPTRGRKRMELFHGMMEGKNYGQLKDLISYWSRLRVETASKWECTSESRWKQQKTKEERKKIGKEINTTSFCRFYIDFVAIQYIWFLVVVSRLKVRTVCVPFNTLRCSSYSAIRLLQTTLGLFTNIGCKHRLWDYIVFIITRFSSMHESYILSPFEVQYAFLCSASWTKAWRLYDLVFDVFVARNLWVCSICKNSNAAESRAQSLPEAEY